MQIMLMEDIFVLEKKGQFDSALEAYTTLYQNHKNDYQVWKHLYFFLWLCVVDELTSFEEKIDPHHLLLQVYEEGIKEFFNEADFNFLAGYTIGIFPYVFGNEEEQEKKSKGMLLKATQLEPENLIYRLAYVSSTSDGENKVYKKAVIDAAPRVLQTFNGDGLLNEYFRQVLYRTRKGNISRFKDAYIQIKNGLKNLISTNKPNTNQDLSGIR